MRTSAIILAVLGFLALCGPHAAIAATQDHAGHGGQAAVTPHPGLTAEQHAAAERIYAQYGKNIWMMRQQIKAKRIELNALSVADKPDQNRIKTLAQEIAGLTERKVLAEAEMRRQLVQAGVPIWTGRGRGMGMMGGGMGMGGMGCPMMRGHGGGDSGAGPGGGMMGMALEEGEE